MAVDRNRMAELHELFAAELFGGEKSRASGATWKNQGDGENNRMSTPFAFTWDCKSTRGKSITIDRAMIEKITEEAGGQDPAIPLRYYDTDDLREIGHDWVAMPAAVLGELLAAARMNAAAQDLTSFSPPGLATEAAFPDPGVYEGMPLHGTYPATLPLPPHELYPCLVIDARHDPDTNQVTNSGYFIADSGLVTAYDITSVRIEPDAAAESRLIVNETHIHRAQLYIDGKLKLQVGGPRR